MYKTVNEVAQIFAVKPLTVRRWIKDKKIKSFKIIGSIRIEESEIERLKKGE